MKLCCASSGQCLSILMNVQNSLADISDNKNLSLMTANHFAALFSRRPANVSVNFVQSNFISESSRINL